MENNNGITKEEYIESKLCNEIASLKKQLAEAEFVILLLKQEIKENNSERFEENIS